MEEFLNNFELLRVVYKWRKQLIIIFIATFGLAAVISSPLVIKPRFKSWAVLYPSNLNSYSNESPTEQMLQLFESDSIRNSVIEKFDLGSHYGLEKGKNAYKYYLWKEYEERISFSKTEYESVLIEVYDVSPDTAEKIVWELIDLFNARTRELHASKYRENALVYKQQMENKQKEMGRLYKEIEEMRAKYNIVEYGEQVKNLTKQYAKVVGLPSRAKQAKELKEQLETLKEKGPEYQQKADNYSRMVNEYNTARLDFEKMQMEVNKNITYTNSVVKPYKADKKSYPVRWLICAVSVMSAMLVSVVVIALIERVRDFNNQHA